jgi:hypothetical protein
MGKIVGTTVAQRLLLSRIGNNAIIITPTADLKVVVPVNSLFLVLLELQDNVVLQQED